MSYSYDYSLRLGDRLKSVKFEKRDIKTLATGTALGGYFNIGDRLVWEFNFFYISWYINRQFWNTFITVREVPFQYYDLWNNEADIVISSSNNEWALLVHWWQRQAAVESSLRVDERALDTPPAKPCARPSEAVRHFEVELWQDGYGGLYKAKRFPWCLGGTSISSI